MDVRRGAPGPDAPTDRAGLEELYEARYLELVRLAYLLTSSNEAAVDLCHDAFLGCHERWSSIEHPVAYLRAAVVRAAAGHHRRRARERRALARTPVSPDAQTAPHDEYVLDLLAGLPYRQQAVLVLRYWGDLTEQEIADAIGCRVGSVGPTRQRALEQLRSALAEEQLR